MHQIINRTSSAVQSGFAKVAALVTLAAISMFALVPLPALALADAATARITAAETDIMGILIILVGVVFLFVLYSLIKRAK